MPVTLILGAGRSSKSRRLGLKIKSEGPGLLKIGAGFLGVVNEGVAPEYGTPTTEGLRTIPGTGVKTLNGGLSNLKSSSLGRWGKGGVGGGPLKGTLMVWTCRLGGNPLWDWDT